MATRTRTTPVESTWLERFELAVKQVPGLVPEQALADARDELRRAEPEWPPADAASDEELERRLTAALGTPEQRAERLAAEAPAVVQRPGKAPGWRLCCTACGRSSPAARLGVTRIGARSLQRYAVGRCGGCQRLRWLHLIRDLETANLTPRILEGLSPQRIRERLHRPHLVIASALGLVVLLLAFAGTILWLMV